MQRGARFHSRLQCVTSFWQSVDSAATELVSVVPTLLHYYSRAVFVVQNRGNHPDEQGGGINSTDCWGGW